MDLSGKSYSPSQGYLQGASNLVSPYGLGTSLMNSSVLATSLYSGSSPALASPVYSGSYPNQSPSRGSHSNGHSMSGGKTPTSEAKNSSPYVTSPPVFSHTNDAFPYGISGVPMPNYGYHGDVYQFTSNGYPRKSRTCSYCGKVFTRSTTRRYHERRCPLLRAAVSSYMGDESSGQSQSTRVPAGEAGMHIPSAYKAATGSTAGMGQLISGNSRSKDPQELATSRYVSSPASSGEKSGDMLMSEQPLSGYHHKSVIVKQEPHELDLSTTDQQTFAQGQSDSVLDFSPESNDSPQKLDSSYNVSNVSPSLPMMGMDLSKSPSYTSSGLRDENISLLNEDLVRDHLKSHSDSELEFNQAQYGSYCLPDGSQPPLRASRSIDLTNDIAEREMMEGIDLRNGLGRDSNDGFDDKDSQDVNNVDDTNSTEVEVGNTVGKKVIGNLKCGICMKSFESAGKLHLHEQLHTKFKPYSCKFCGQKFAKASLRIAHEKTHNGMDTTHVCAVCGSSFTRKYSLKLHMRRWHQEGPWLCRHCGKTSVTQPELKSHLFSHNLPRFERESLYYMPDLSSSSYEYTVTQPTSVTGMNGTTPLQDYKGSSSAAGNNPEVGADGQEMEMCQECGRDFPKGYMRFHLKSHETQKPYSCPICGKKFGYKNNMKSHIKLHTGIKPFQCKMCGAKFTRGSTLRRHARRHGIMADSVWDLFIKPNYRSRGQQGTGNIHNSGDSNNVSKLVNHSQQQQQQQQQQHQPQHTSDDSTVIPQQPTTGSMSVGSSIVGESSNYLVDGISISPPDEQSLFPMYQNMGQLQPPALYTSISNSTSVLPQQPHIPQQPSVRYAAAAAAAVVAASSQPPHQLDALNLSLQKASSNERMASDQSPFSNVSGERSRSRSRSLSGSDLRRIQYVPPRPGYQDAVVQVHTCCHQGTGHGAADTPSSQSVNGGCGTPLSPLAVMPYIVTSPQQATSLDATSPVSATSGKDYSTETISTLIGSGRMFKCYHCECYFSEYAMYRIHAKLHSRDFTRPFVCLICGEDCHDKVYFAMHISEHLR